MTAHREDAAGVNTPPARPDPDCSCLPCRKLVCALDEHVARIRAHADRLASRRAVRSAARMVDALHGLNG